MDEIYILRHASTPANKTRRYMGSADVPADPSSLADAAGLMETVERLGIANYVCSPLCRAAETAAAVAPRAAWVKRRWASERMLGSWEGMSYADVRKDYVEAFLSNDALDPLYAAPFGETFEAFSARVAQGMEELRSLEGSSLLVTHNGWIRTLMYLKGEIALNEIFANSIPHLVLIALQSDSV